MISEKIAARNKMLTFNQKTHSYLVEGKSIPHSVTEIVKKSFPIFDADKIVDQNFPTWQKTKFSKYKNFTKEEIKILWKKEGMRAMKRGKALHTNIENFFKIGIVNNPTKEMLQFLQFHNDTKLGKPLAVEWKIHGNGTAGTVDACFENSNGGLDLFDWKCAKEIKKLNQYESGLGCLEYLPNTNFWRYAIQLNIYKFILEENYDARVDSMKLVLFHSKREKYSIEKVPILKKETKKLLAQNFL